MWPSRHNPINQNFFIIDSVVFNLQWNSYMSLKICFHPDNRVAVHESPFIVLTYASVFYTAVIWKYLSIIGNDALRRFYVKLSQTHLKKYKTQIIIATHTLFKVKSNWNLQLHSKNLKSLRILGTICWTFFYLAVHGSDLLYNQ